MQLGDIVNAGAADAGKPLDGVRILAVEQMQALPFATQLLGRLGAEVVKVESVAGGDQAAPGAFPPSSTRTAGTSARRSCATISANGSIAVDLKHPSGIEIVLGLAERFDVFAENSKAGAMARLGLGFDEVRARRSDVVYASVSGFGNGGGSPYGSLPAYAPIVEAMSGIYEFKRAGDDPPVVAPVGALGDIGAALFASVGILAAAFASGTAPARRSTSTSPCSTPWSR